MVENTDRYGPGDILIAVSGLTRDKLNYWVLKGYIQPIQITKGKSKQVYNNYTNDTLALTKEAYQMIVVDGLKDSKTFERLREESQMKLKF